MVTSRENEKLSGTNKISLLPILSVNFVGTLGFSIVLPFLVFLVTKWGGNALIYGLIGATYSVFQLIGAPILGRWSDKFGRRKILLLSQIGTLISWAIFLLAFFLPVHIISEIDSTLFGKFTLTLPLVILFIARAADGITGGNVSVANAYLADVTSEADRSKNFGRMAVSANMGFIVGPMLAGLLGATLYGEVLPVIAALIISLVAALIIGFGLKESIPCVLTKDPEKYNVRKVFGQEHKECFRIVGSEKLSVSALLKLPHIAGLMLINFLIMLGFSFFYVAFPVHAVTGLAWSVVDTGIFFAVLSIFMVIVQGPIFSRLSNKYEDTQLVLIGSIILSAGFALLVGSSNLSIYTAALLIALGNGLMWPSVLGLVSKFAGDQHQGAIQGFASSSGAVASIVGLTLGGLLYNWVQSWVFIFSAIILLSVAMIVLAQDNRKDPPEINRSGSASV